MDIRYNMIAQSVYKYFRKKNPQDMTIEMVDNYIFNLMESTRKNIAELNDFDNFGHIRMWFSKPEPYVYYLYNKNNNMKFTSKLVAMEYYILVLMRKLAFMCMLYKNTLFGKITFGKIGIYNCYNVSRICEPPYKTTLRTIYNDIISDYNDIKQLKYTDVHFHFPTYDLADKVQSNLSHLEDLLNDDKYIPTSTSSTYYYGASISTEVPYLTEKGRPHYFPIKKDNGIEQGVIYSFSLKTEMDEFYEKPGDKSDEIFCVKLMLNIRHINMKYLI